MELIGNMKKQGSIVEALKEEILSGNIPGGKEITQNELASALGVSRMPIREALIVLEYQGLIVRLPNNRVRVVDFSDGYFDRVYNLCVKLETDALEAHPDYTWKPEAETHRKMIGKRVMREIQLANAEMTFHRNLCLEVSNIFFKKTLETIIETYIAFGVLCESYAPECGTEKLLQVMNSWKRGEKDQAIIFLNSYFAGLSEAVKKEREK